MAKTEWSPAFAVGIAAIDEQHKVLGDLLNEVQRLAAVSTASVQDVDQLFDQLASHFAAHFRDEEALLLSIDYDLLAQHKQEHADIIRQLAQHRQAYFQGRINLQVFYDWLLRGFMKHVAGSDLLIPKFLARNGISL